MSEGLATYERLKKHLEREGRTLTEYAAAIGTGIPQVYKALVTFAGSDRIPRHPITRKILATVEADLHDDNGTRARHQDVSS